MCIRDRGGIALAQKVLETLEHRPGNFRVLYPDDISLKDKIHTVATEIYGADGVTYAPAASKALKNIEDMGFGNLPVCMAKTQYSLSDDQTKLGRPTGFTINVRDAYVSAGAGLSLIHIWNRQWRQDSSIRWAGLRKPLGNCMR